MASKHLFWIIPGIIIITFGFSYHYGFTEGWLDESLNFKNGENFCESLNDFKVYYDITWGRWKWCSQGLQTITCSTGDSCFRQEGSMQMVFGNPGLELLEINYFEGDGYPNPFRSNDTDKYDVLLELG